MLFQNVQDVLNARLEILAERGQLTAGQVLTAKGALETVLTEGGDELMTALENAMWMDKTVAEVGHPVREGIDNDGLTEDEATAALDEQTTWPQDEFGREIDPALLKSNRIAMFAKVGGDWRFEGFMGQAHSVISQPVAEFKEMVEAENGAGTAFVVKLPS